VATAVLLPPLATPRYPGSTISHPSFSLLPHLAPHHRGTASWTNDAPWRSRTATARTGRTPTSACAHTTSCALGVSGAHLVYHSSLSPLETLIYLAFLPLHIFCCGLPARTICRLHLSACATYLALALTPHTALKTNVVVFCATAAYCRLYTLRCAHAPGAERAKHSAWNSSCCASPLLGRPTYQRLPWQPAAKTSYGA